jgi:hypothetical protein
VLDTTIVYTQINTNNINKMKVVVPQTQITVVDFYYPV